MSLSTRHGSFFLLCSALATGCSAVVAGCSDDKAAPAASQSASAQPLSAQPSATALPERATVMIKLDGKGQAVEITGRTLLAEVLPAAGKDPTKWRQLSASAGDGHVLNLRKMSEKYADHDAYLYMEDGKPTLGLFRRVRDDSPPHVKRIAATSRVKLTAIESVEVRTVEVAAEAEAPPITLDVVMGDKATGDKRHTLDRVALEKLKAHPRPGALQGAADGKPGANGKDGDQGADRAVRMGSNKARGWHIRDVVGAAFPDVTIRRVTIVAGKERKTLDAAAIGDAARLPLIRANRRGQFGFEMYEGDNPKPTVRLRKITQLIVNPPD